MHDTVGKNYSTSIGSSSVMVELSGLNSTYIAAIISIIGLTAFQEGSRLLCNDDSVILSNRNSHSGKSFTMLLIANSCGKKICIERS